ncbi:MAG TPA: pyridoxal-phosphate dependent enzyme, partial [Steroidobacter sp.]
QPLLRAPGKSLVVEPDAAPCVAEALRVGEPTLVAGDLHTSASMLACGVASAPALRILQRHSVASVLVSDVQLRVAATELASAGGPATTESGATGLAGLLRVSSRPELRARHQLDYESIVLLIATERA